MISDKVVSLALLHLAAKRMRYADVVGLLSLILRLVNDRPSKPTQQSSLPLSGLKFNLHRSDPSSEERLITEMIIMNSQPTNTTLTIGTLKLS